VIKKNLYPGCSSSTRTVQPRSLAVLNKEGKDLTVNGSGTENNTDLLLSVIESLNNLYDKLSRLCDLLEKRYIEQSLFNQE